MRRSPRHRLVSLTRRTTGGRECFFSTGNTSDYLSGVPTAAANTHRFHAHGQFQFLRKRRLTFWVTHLSLQDSRGGRGDSVSRARVGGWSLPRSVAPLFWMACSLTTGSPKSIIYANLMRWWLIILNVPIIAVSGKSAGDYSLASGMTVGVPRVIVRVQTVIFCSLDPGVTWLLY